MMKKEPMGNIQLRLPRELIARIDVFCEKMPMHPSRTQAIRWLLENGLASQTLLKQE